MVWKRSADLPPPPISLYDISWRPHPTLASSHCCHEPLAFPWPLRQMMVQMLDEGEAATSIQKALWLPSGMANASGVSQHHPNKCSNNWSCNYHFISVLVVPSACSTPGVIKVSLDSVIYGGWFNLPFSTFLPRHERHDSRITQRCE